MVGRRMRAIGMNTRRMLFGGGSSPSSETEELRALDRIKLSEKAARFRLQGKHKEARAINTKIAQMSEPHPHSPARMPKKARKND